MMCKILLNNLLDSDPISFQMRLNAARECDDKFCIFKYNDDHVYKLIATMEKLNFQRIYNIEEKTEFGFRSERDGKVSFKSLESGLNIEDDIFELSKYKDTNFDNYQGFL